MSTHSDNNSTQQQNGPLESLYKEAKSYFSKLPDNQIVLSLDTRLEKVAETCDKLVLSTSLALKGTLQMLPSPQKVKTFVIDSSEKTIERIQEFLNSTIRTLGGKIEQAKENSGETINRLLVILSKTIEVNSLLVKNSANQILEYVQTPSTIVADSKVWANKIRIQASAVSITIRDLLVNTTNQILSNLGAQYTQTKNKVKVLLTNVNQPQKAISLLKERLVDVKNVTVKRVQSGIQIIMDRQHYSQNLKKLASSLLDVLQTITVKADNVIETSSSFTKDLYQQTIRNYKIQKILLTKRTSEVQSVTSA